ncbi:hypothetical protein EDB87DRAFT_1623991 [Lactarius vividus]|nr:hypothetical protein EDB87DRAFT_1623991 [Lactarius vividus]
MPRALGPNSSLRSFQSRSGFVCGLLPFRTRVLMASHLAIDLNACPSPSFPLSLITSPDVLPTVNDDSHPYSSRNRPRPPPRLMPPLSIDLTPWARHIAQLTNPSLPFSASPILPSITPPPSRLSVVSSHLQDAVSGRANRRAHLTIGFVCCASLCLLSFVHRLSYAFALPFT